MTGMGIGNRTLWGPALLGNLGTVNVPEAFARMRAARERSAVPAAPMPPVVDIGARVRAAQEAADRVRRRASGANTPTPAAPRTPAPAVNLNPRPGSWRLY